MGKPFKIQYNRSKKVKVEKKEEKMTYDHISRFPEPSQGTMANFNKNMNIPSELWEGDVYMNTQIHTKVNKSGKPYCPVEVPILSVRRCRRGCGTTILKLAHALEVPAEVYTMRVTPRALIFTRD